MDSSEISIEKQPQSGGSLLNWPDWEESIRQYVSVRMKGVDPAVIDDIVQEVGIAATKRHGEDKLPNKPIDWLRGVAKHKINDHWRHKSKRPTNNVIPDELQSEDLTPYEWVLKAEKVELVTEALRELPDDERVLLQKKYLEEESCQSLSRRLGKSLKSIEYRLTKARRSLRSLINRKMENKQ